MEIGKEIKQPKFDNEFHKLVINILFTGRWLESRVNGFLKQFGLTSQQYNVLRILRGQHPDPATINLIIERMLDKTSNASRLVEKLRIKGWVERQSCSTDRRAVDVVITAQGLAVLEKIDNAQRELDDKLRNLSVAEAVALNNLLDKFRG